MHPLSPGRTLPWLATILTISGFPVASAQMASRPTSPPPRTTGSDSVDRAVVFTLIKADRDEVAIARAALPSLHDAETKVFAQRMIDDHEANLTAISTTGTRLGYTPPAAPPPPVASASTNDTQYIEAQVIGHRQLLGQLPSDLVVIKDAGLRQQVSDTRHTVQMHLDDALRLQARLGGKLP